MKTNYANDTKAQAAAKPLATPARDRGTRHIAVIDSAETTFYSTGSFGVKLKYAVEGLERPVYENVILKKMGEDGNLVATKYGAQTLLRRLSAAGLTSEQQAAIAIPKAKTDNSEFAPLKGQRIAVYLAEREYMGKTFYDVRSTWPLNENE